jgi:hypothetical protein
MSAERNNSILLGTYDLLRGSLELPEGFATQQSELLALNTRRGGGGSKMNPVTQLRMSRALIQGISRFLANAMGKDTKTVRYLLGAAASITLALVALRP